MEKTVPNPRRAIFEAARDLLDGGGWDAVDMRGVAQRAGVAVGTIYNYYRGKSDLKRDMMLLRWSQFTARQSGSAATRLTLLVRLYNFYRAFSEFAREWSGWEREGGGEDAPVYMELAVESVEKMLLGEARQNGVKPRLGVNDTARFIVFNFLAMARTPAYRYELFELVLRELLGISHQ